MLTKPKQAKKRQGLMIAMDPDASIMRYVTEKGFFFRWSRKILHADRR